MTTTITDKLQERRVLQARINIVLDEPFFGALLMRLPMVEDSSVKTFSTNGERIYYNPAFAASKSDAEIKGVLMHEVEHVALLHPWRRGDREHRLFNQAADYAINNYLKAYLDEAQAKHNRVPFALPNEALLDPQYKDLSAEEIYARLPKPPPEQKPDPNKPGDGKGDKGDSPSGGQPDPNGQDGDKGGPGEADDNQPPSSDGEFTDAPGDDSERQESEDSMKVAVVQAAEAAKAQGFAPSSLTRLVKELTEPKLPWQELLRDWMVQQAAEDYSWTRPNRRFLASGFIMPSLNGSAAMGTLVVAVDSSGSIGQRELDSFLSELTGIMRDCQPEKTVVLVCDARVQTEREFQRGEELEAELKGGGGTDFRPVFNRVDELNEEVAGLIYMTDLLGSFPDTAPNYPVMWAATRDGKAPFGDTVRLAFE